jgi:hypothetical protein
MPEQLVMEATRIEAMYLARLVLYSVGREKRVRG